MGCVIWNSPFLFRSSLKVFFRQLSWVTPIGRYFLSHLTTGRWSTHPSHRCRKVNGAIGSIMMLQRPPPLLQQQCAKWSLGWTWMDVLIFFSCFLPTLVEFGHIAWNLLKYFESKTIYWNRGLNRLLEWQDFLQDLFRTGMARSMHTWTAWLVLYQAVWKLSPWVEVFLPTALLVHQQCGNQLEETTCFWGCEGWQQGDMLRAAQNIKKWGQRIRQIYMIFPCSRFVSRFLYFINMIRPEMMGNSCGYFSSFLK